MKREKGELKSIIK